MTGIAIDKILNSSALSTSIFIAGGCCKTYKDYKSANEKYKDKFLVKDCVVLSGAALGMLAFQGCADKAGKSKLYSKIKNYILPKINKPDVHNGVRNSIHYAKEITKDLSLSFMSTASGILGALGMDWLLSKSDFEQPQVSNAEKIKEHQKNRISAYIDSNVTKYADENTKSVFYTSVTDMPAMKFLSSGMVGTQAIEIAKDREFNKKLKHTTGYLVNDTLVPLIFLSVSSALTKGFKSKYRIPVIFFSLFGGTLATQKILDKINLNR